jgi:Protein tyrosine and serine/threonine kinase
MAMKAQNILVDSKFRAKVSDFGLSQKKSVGGMGAPYWMAQELLRDETSNTIASDVYSFGITLYEVYSRLDLYEGEIASEVLHLVANSTVNKRPPIPKDSYYIYFWHQTTI